MLNEIQDFETEMMDNFENKQIKMKCRNKDDQKIAMSKVKIQNFKSSKTILQIF